MCNHENFQSRINVNRIEEPDELRFVADIQVRCSDCHAFFRFLGIPALEGNNSPHVSLDETELHIPIAPVPSASESRIVSAHFDMLGGAN
jgi:hypothetical protein